MPNTTAADTVGMTDAGRKPATTPEDVLAVFADRADRAEPMTAPELADRLNCSRRTALNKLHDLADAGDVSSKKVGGRSKVWWVPIHDATPTAPDRRDVGESTVETPARTSPVGNTGESTDADTDRLTAEDDLAATVREYLDANDIPPKTAHGRGAVIDVFRYLREHGTTKTGDIQDAVYPEYSDSWSTPRTMWNAVDRHLEAVPGVEKAGYGEWGYAGDDAVRTTLEGTDA